MKLSRKERTSITLSAEEIGMLEDIQKKLELQSRSETVAVCLTRVYHDLSFPKVGDEVREIHRYLQLILLETIKSNNGRDDWTPEELAQFKSLKKVARTVRGMKL